MVSFPSGLPWAGWWLVFVILGVYASHGNGCKVWEQTCLSQFQGGERYPQSFEDLTLVIKKQQDSQANVE